MKDAPQPTCPVTSQPTPAGACEHRAEPTLQDLAPIVWELICQGMALRLEALSQEQVTT